MNIDLPHLKQKKDWTMVPMIPVYTAVRCILGVEILRPTINGMLTCHQALATSSLATSGLAYLNKVNKC
jgi:hypothetical protein